MAVCLPTGNSIWSPSKAAARRAAKRKSQFFCNIDLTGLLSIELTLLIIFMTLPTPHHHDAVVDWPHAVNVTAQPGANRDDVMRVVVSRDGNTYFRTSKIEVSELHNRLREEIQNGSEAKVYLYIDARARNADIEPAVDEIQLAGITRIAIIASGPSGASTLPPAKSRTPSHFYFPGIHHIPAG
jgi:biopolymer transport protein ExbD